MAVQMFIHDIDIEYIINEAIIRLHYMILWIIVTLQGISSFHWQNCIIHR